MLKGGFIAWAADGRRERVDPHPAAGAARARCSGPRRCVAAETSRALRGRGRARRRARRPSARQAGARRSPTPARCGKADMIANDATAGRQGRSGQLRRAHRRRAGRARPGVRAADGAALLPVLMAKSQWRMSALHCSLTPGSPAAGTCTPAGWRRPLRAGSSRAWPTWRRSCAAGCGRRGWSRLHSPPRRSRPPRGAGDPLAGRSTPSWTPARRPPAQREASRAQGRAAAARRRRVAWPSPVLDALVAATPRPHHPLLLGAVIGIDGGSPPEAAQCAGYLAVSGPAQRGGAAARAGPVRGQCRGGRAAPRARRGGRRRPPSPRLGPTGCPRPVRRCSTSGRGPRPSPREEVRLFVS